jgi:hypothetical protein
MTEYIVVSIDPFSNKRKLTIINQDSSVNAYKMAENQRRTGKDVIVLKKELIKNTYNQKEESTYTVENYGYYKVYALLNKIISIIILFMILGIVYLYYKFFHH